MAWKTLVGEKARRVLIMNILILIIVIIIILVLATVIVTVEIIILRILLHWAGRQVRTYTPY